MDKTLIACETFDLTTRQLCQDGLIQELELRGAHPVVVPAATQLFGRELESQLATSAAAVGANAVFILTLAPATTALGSGLSVGVGGFSFGRNSGAGIGLSFPVGGGWGSTGFSANGRVTDVRNGRVVWSSSFVSSSSSDLGAQFRSLTRAVLDSAQNAGLL